MKRQLKTWTKRLWNDQAGIILVVTTLLFPTLLAFLGLALDIGTIFHLKRRQQKAADTGAMGAGYELLRDDRTWSPWRRATTRLSMGPYIISWMAATPTLR